MSDPVAVFRATLDSGTLATLDALREAVAAADDRLVEGIKWNAPSFALGGEDRITLGLERKGGVRLVLHRGAARRTDGFAFADPEGLARWPSPDRGVIVFRDAAEVAARATGVTALCARWLAAAA